MGWATQAIGRLQTGSPVTLRPRGHSIHGLVEDGQTVVVSPIPDAAEIRKGDIVLCRVRGHEYLHLVLAVSNRGFLIGNNRGGVNGWVPRTHVFGRLKRHSEG